MNMIVYLTIISISAVYAQENALRNVPNSLLECYNNMYLLDKDNRLPHTINTLIAILRKIENTIGLNMDLRSLSVALLHRFRQDGIEWNPSVQVQSGVTPYAPNGLQFSRHAAALRLISGNAMLFPNNSISDVERCTLHFMLSSSIEIYERGDEATDCRVTSSMYRIPRSITGDVIADSDKQTIINDVETLSPEELEIMRDNKEEPKVNTIDPNWSYPELPPNHPDSARILVSHAHSRCPVENGVIKTRWGAIAGGPIVAGIAAALQPQTVSLGDLLRKELQERGYASGVALDNKWIATLAGDLAEVALIEGPLKDGPMKVGVDGNWNSTALPKWYFLGSNENLEFTSAEIRGDLDGLILASNVSNWYTKIPSLRLSQILDMYYNARGVFNSAARACNRRNLLTSVAPNETISAQAYSAALVLNEDVASVTIDASITERFAVSAVNALLTHVPSSMNDDLSCITTDQINDFNHASVDLTIILDTNWPFNLVQPIIATLLESLEISKFNSNFTLLNAYDGNIMINNSDTLLDFYNFNFSNYDKFTRGFDLPKSFEALRTLQTNKLNTEQTRGLGGGNSDVVLIISYSSSVSESDKDYCLERLKTINEEVPDALILFLTYGSKDKWSNLVIDSSTDIFSISTEDTIDTLEQLTSLVSRIKQNPKRLINSQCGANYESIGQSRSFVDYIEPSGVNFYRLHPNYFFTSDTTNVPTVKIEGSGWGTLTVCTSRNILNVNTTQAIAAATCTTATSNTHSFPLSCYDASVIRECKPLYISVTSNSSNTESYQCTDASVCRYPDMIKFTFSYENLRCTSSASTIILRPIIFILTIVYFYYSY